jgi:hypothetical protein
MPAAMDGPILTEERMEVNRMYEKKLPAMKAAAELASLASSFAFFYFWYFSTCGDPSRMRVGAALVC